MKEPSLPFDHRAIRSWERRCAPRSSLGPPVRRRVLPKRS